MHQSNFTGKLFFIHYKNIKLVQWDSFDFGDFQTLCLAAIHNFIIRADNPDDDVGDVSEWIDPPDRAVLPEPEAGTVQTRDSIVQLYF